MSPCHVCECVDCVALRLRRSAVPCLLEGLWGGERFWSPPFCLLPASGLQFTVSQYMCKCKCVSKYKSNSQLRTPPKSHIHCALPHHTYIAPLCLTGPERAGCENSTMPMVCCRQGRAQAALHIYSASVSASVASVSASFLHISAFAYISIRICRFRLPRTSHAGSDAAELGLPLAVLGAVLRDCGPRGAERRAEVLFRHLV